MEGAVSSSYCCPLPSLASCRPALPPPSSPITSQPGESVALPPTSSHGGGHQQQPRHCSRHRQHCPLSSLDATLPPPRSLVDLLSNHLFAAMEAAISSSLDTVVATANAALQTHQPTP
ncbi:unnamed protein product [Closterium sp. NIES-53]